MAPKKKREHMEWIALSYAAVLLIGLVAVLVIVSMQETPRRQETRRDISLIEQQCRQPAKAKEYYWAMDRLGQRPQTADLLTVTLASKYC